MSVILKSTITRLARASSGARKAVLLAGVFAGAGLGAYQAHAATATANGTATVMTPIAITADVDLDFGAFSALTGGTVVISNAGARSATGAVVLSASDTGNAASFTVTGQADATYAITLPPSATLTHTDTVTTMSVGTFTSNPSSTGTLTAGTETLTVGATLTVASSQAAGSYTGTFDVSVEYN